MCLCFLMIRKWADCIFMSSYTRQALGSQPMLVEGVANSVAHLMPYWVWTGVSWPRVLSRHQDTWVYSPLEASSPATRSLQKTQLNTAPVRDRQEKEKKGRRTGSKQGSCWGLGKEEGAGGGPGLAQHSFPAAKCSSPCQMSP